MALTISLVVHWVQKLVSALGSVFSLGMQLLVQCEYTSDVIFLCEGTTYLAGVWGCGWGWVGGCVCQCRLSCFIISNYLQKDFVLMPALICSCRLGMYWEP